MTAEAPSRSKHTGVPGRRGGNANIALWVVQVVTAAAFLMAATTKITGAAPVVATFDAIGFGDWFRYLIAGLEVAGAAALLIPALAGLAGLAFVALMVGAAVFHAAVIGAGVGTVVVPLLLAAVVAWGRRRSTAELVGSLLARKSAS